MWRQLLRDSGAPIRDSEGTGQSRGCTSAELDALEGTLAVRLPKRYRDFCQELGPGELGADDDTVQIKAPGRSRVAGLARYVKDGRDYLRFAIEEGRRTAPQYGLPEIPADLEPDRIVPFAADHSGASFFWRTDEPTVGDEYAIYAIADEVPPRVFRIADSFEEFIRITARGARGLVDIGLYGATATGAEPDEYGFWPITR